MDLGTDVMIIDDYKKSAQGDLQLIKGIENLREAIYRRLITMPGEIIHRPDYGVGVRRYLNRPNTNTNKQELANAVKLNIIKEPRLETIKQVSCDWYEDVVYIIVKAKAYSQDIEFDYKVVNL